MIAVKRLQGLFWIVLVALGALSAYLVSLRVATERNAVARVRAQIAQVRGDIRYLETEFSARANMRQLEQWNVDVFRYSVSGADRYLDGERSLAKLDGMAPNGPTYEAPPVMVAMMESETAPSSTPATASDAPVASPAASQIRGDVAAIRVAQVRAEKPAQRPGAPVKLAQGTASPDKSAPVRSGTNGDTGALARKAERMAMLDARLLDDGTLGDIGRRAALETRQGGR